MQGIAKNMPVFGQLQAFVLGRKQSPRSVDMPHHYHSRIQSVDMTRLQGGQTPSCRATSMGDRQPHALEDLQSTTKKDDATELHPGGISSQDFEAIMKRHARDLEELQIECTALKKHADKCRKESHRLRAQCNEARHQCGKETAHRAESEKQRKELTHQHRMATQNYKHIAQKVISPYAHAKSLEWNAYSPETMAMVLEPLVADAVEASDLRGQVATLQNELLARRDKVEVVSDEYFAKDFRTLANLVKSITRVVRPMQDLDITEITGSFGLLHGVDKKPWGAQTRRKFLIEAWIWSVLCEYVYSCPFDWFSNEGKDLAFMWTGLYGRDHIGGWPKPTPLSETWRTTTSAQVAGQLHPKAMAEGPDDTDSSFRNLDYSVINHRALVFSLIMNFLSTVSGVEALPEVHTIVHKAFDLALQMSSQRFRLQIIYPQVGLPFDEKTMKPMDDPEDDSEDEDVKKGIVAFVLSPGLAKWGNAHGKDFHQRLDIVKATVKLEEASPAEGISLL